MKRQVACASLRSFPFLKIGLLLGLSCLMLGGCAPEELRQINGNEVEPVTSKDVAITSYSMSSKLEMVDGDSVIRVGQLLEDSLRGSYGKPPKATSLTELPPGLDETFEVKGWETYKRTFALVAKEDRVALALDFWEDADASKIRDAETEYELKFGKPDFTVVTDRNSYSFWQDGSVRLMTLQSEGRNGMSFTVALGLTVLMDHLRMSPDTARNDAARAEQLLSSETETKGELSTSE